MTTQRVHDRSQIQWLQQRSRIGTERGFSPRFSLRPRLATVLLASAVVACGGGGNSNVSADSPTEQPDIQEPGNDQLPDTGENENGAGDPGNDSNVAPEQPTVTEPPRGNISTSEGGTIGSITTRLTDQQFADQFSAPAGRVAAPADTIAYFDDSNPDTVSFRMISSAGTDDRQFLSIPNAASGSEAPNSIFETVIVDGLSWRPDGTEVTFASNFEVSGNRTEIYAATIDGENLRRLTSVPRPIAYANYPQGRIELPVQYPDLNSGLAVGYFEGAQQAYGWLGFAQERRTLRFQVADLGPGVRQQAMLTNFGICHFDAVNNLDVVAGQTQTAPRLLPPLLLTIGYPCPTIYTPQWINNDQLAFIKRDHVGRSVVTSFSPAFSVLQTQADDLAPTTPTPELARYSTFDRIGNVYFNIVEGDSREFLYLRLQSQSDNFLLIDRVNSPLSNQEDKVFAGRMSEPDSSRLRRVSICPNALNCDVVDAKWLTGSFAFVYTSIDSLNRASIRLYTEQNGTASHETLVSVSDGRLGRLAVSPDGNRVVVERQFESSTGTQLWMLDRQSGAFEELVASGKNPAWR